MQFRVSLGPTKYQWEEVRPTQRKAMIIMVVYTHVGGNGQSKSQLAENLQIMSVI